MYHVSAQGANEHMVVGTGKSLNVHYYNYYYNKWTALVNIKKIWMNF